MHTHTHTHTHTLSTDTEVLNPLADPRGCWGRTPPLAPISSIFMQFLAKILPNNRFLLKNHGLTLPLGNPESATEIIHIVQN